MVEGWRRIKLYPAHHSLGGTSITDTDKKGRRIDRAILHKLYLTVFKLLLGKLSDGCRWRTHPTESAVLHVTDHKHERRTLAIGAIKVLGV